MLEGEIQMKSAADDNEISGGDAQKSLAASRKSSRNGRKIETAARLEVAWKVEPSQRVEITNATGRGFTADFAGVPAKEPSAPILQAQPKYKYL